MTEIPVKTEAPDVSEDPGITKVNKNKEYGKTRVNENKFRKEIEEAIDSTQVREDDNMKMFMETCPEEWCEDLYVRTRPGSVSVDDVRPDLYG